MQTVQTSPLPAASAHPYSLTELDLLDAPEERDFNALTTLAARLFDVPVALISVIDDEQDRQFFKSQVGLSEPWASKRGTPLTHSFCQHVRRSGKLLVVNDASKHELVCDNLAIRDLGVTSYLGAPIRSPAGEPLGALCVIDTKRRTWTKADADLLTNLARCVSNEIRLKAEKLASEGLYDNLSKEHHSSSRHNALREWMFGAFMAPDLSPAERFEALLRNGCDALGMDMAVITKVEYDRIRVLFGHGLPGRVSKGSYAVGGTLSSFLVSGQNQFHFRDVKTSNAVGWRTFLGRSPASFAGIPIVLEGQIFGTLELSSRSPRQLDWSSEDLSLLSQMSMLSCVYLGMVDKIDMLERSETASLIHNYQREKSAAGSI